MDSSVCYPETYDIFTSSDDYATRFHSRTGEWFLKVQENATLRMLAPYPNATVLDVGGGHGQSMDALLRTGHKVTVLGSADVCRNLIQPYLDAGRAEFAVGNILAMPYPDQAFDVVICYRMTAHVMRWQEYLKELARVAKQAVILDYPELRSINYIAPQLFGIKKRLEPNTRRFTCFHEKQLLAVFEEAGFHRTDRYPQYFIPMMVHRLINHPRFSSTSERFFRMVGLTSLFGSPVIVKVERSS